ncbi:MAG: tyrosine-protein phosphatase, partial [Chloroflexi bacterium]|nr:tyrosine-protein phosphatase [Chloroflexota bacterium]MCY4615664.1 tyrosine-protein phosphatase [Chloroflexota bacterium]
MVQLATTLERRILLSGVRNFRDLGGYVTRDGSTVRWRTVFRTSTLSDATPLDIERLLDLNVGLVLDLRSAE